MFPRPLIGGVLSNPATRWPNTLGRLRFLRDHPYFLPCGVSGSIALVTFVIATFALKEVGYWQLSVFILFDCSLNHPQTLPSLVAKNKAESLERLSPSEMTIPDATIESPLINHGERLDYGSTTDQVQSSSSSHSEHTTTTSENKRVLLDPGLIMIYINFTCLAFLDMGHFVLLPLFYSTSIPLGGLGLDPYRIGIMLGTFGFCNAIVQARLLGVVIRKFGARKVYITSFPGLTVCVTLYPIMKHLVRRFESVNYLIIICIVVQLSFQTFIFSSYGTYLFFSLAQVTSSNLIMKVLCKLSWHSMYPVVDM